MGRKLVRPARDNRSESVTRMYRGVTAIAARAARRRDACILEAAAAGASESTVRPGELEALRRRSAADQAGYRTGEGAGGRRARCGALSGRTGEGCSCAGPFAHGLDPGGVPGRARTEVTGSGGSGGRAARGSRTYPRRDWSERTNGAHKLPCISDTLDT